jgi:hypothetical protein
MEDPNLARMAEARKIASTIVPICNSYEQAPSQNTINRFLRSVEALADLAEDLEVQQTLRVLNA